MNQSFIVAQANGQGTGKAPVQTIKITKPADGQAVTFEASYDGSVLIDFTAITNEKITLVHVAEKLIILFDNQSTATIEPFFDSMRLPLQNLTIEVGPGQDLSGSEFASTFPITDDQSVLPAAGGNGNAASGANFSSATVDPLGLPNPLPLLGPETLPNFVVTFDQTPNRAGTLVTALGVAGATPSLGGATPSLAAATPSVAAPLPIPSTTAPTLTSSISAGAVDEGGLILGKIGDIYGTGNDPGFATTVSGSFTNLVNFGTSGASSLPFQFVSTTAASNWIASLGVFSHGDAVNTASITISGNSETLIASTSGPNAHEVFSLTLNEVTGQWSFVLINPVDHPNPGVGAAGPAVEDILNLNLSGLVLATAANGDTVTLSNDFVIAVTDDVPVLATGASNGNVDEGNLVAGTPGDLYGNGNDPGPTPTATGSLAALVHFGADGPTANEFQFVSVAAANTWLAGLGLTSHGSLIDAATITTVGSTETLTASAADGHEVFTLVLNESTGTWTFTLINPLDHPTGNGENTATIDLSGLVQAVDFDGDAVTLSNDFSVVVTDDVPVVVPNNGLPAQSSLGAIDEGGLVSGSPGDLYGNGNDHGVAISATGSLAALVHFGADGPAANEFQFVTASAAGTWLTSLGLMSHGSLIDAATITTVGSTETLTASTSGVGAHEVFTLSLDETTGAWTFTLINPLDHPTGNGENTATIDLSGLVQGVDFDGDPVTLSNDFFVTVTDDVPVVVPNNGLPAQSSLGAVDEGGLASGSPGDLYGNGNDHGVAISATGSLAALVHFGADGPAANEFQFVTASAAGTWLTSLGLMSHGSLIDAATITTVGSTETLTASTSGVGAHEVFTLSLDETTGAWTFTLINPLDHPTGNGENTATIDLSGLVQGVDFDGDTATLAHDFFVTVTDDLPVVVPNNGLPAQSSLGTVDDPGTLSATGSLSTLVHFGADGPAANEFQFTTVAAASTWLTGLGLFSHDSQITTASIATSGNTETLTASAADGHSVFTLALNEGTGAWTFTLVSPLDQPAGSQTNTNVIDLSGLVHGVDFDGDTATLAHDFFVTVNGPTDVLSTPALTVDADGTSGGSAAGPEATSGLFSIPVLSLLNNDSDTLGNSPLNFKVTAVSGSGATLTSDHEYVLFPLGGSGNFQMTVSDGTTTSTETVTVNHVGSPVSGSATSGNDFLVENLAAGQNIFGNAGNDTLVANTQGGSNVYGGNEVFPVTGGGNDLLIGSVAGDNLFAGPGNDTLWGRGGGDQLFGNTTANSTTTFLFETPGDGSATINNFDSASGQNDAIAVSAAGFGGGLTANSGVSSVFATAANANFPSGNADRFVFDTSNHGLYYSPDGTTAHEVLLATVTNHTVTAGDIHVVA